ncbi:CGLD27 family protein [Cyanobium sp. CH-040]|uniref:CGLD27 family protein n=1 Tax=Cyanobium sp. CH-040 TaxID=2823708 RepID=UPI0020CE5FB8|nr:CGLD27 family protein [Cyanobium sp. CH-040]MCP9928424.1 CGLD27 family protein [Cyanobium sp. CH-040]
MGDAPGTTGPGTTGDFPGAPADSCPVPAAQRPLQQYQELRDSWFFAWPAGSTAGLLRPLALSWLLILPLTVLVGSGSWVLRHHPVQMVLAGAVAAIVLPTLMLLRQWLGWRSIHQRLMSERVEYEESGWYDGQVWEKPLSWRQQDLLVARHQVRPVLARLQRAMAGASGLMALGGALLLGTQLWQAR